MEDPARNMPIGIIGSLAVSMSIYFAIAFVVVGMAPISLLGEEIPIVNALLANACCSHSEQLMDDATEACLSYQCQPVLHSMFYIGSRIVSFGAIFGLTTATFTCLMGQPRIFYSMAKDGLLFRIYGQINPKTGVPTIGTIITGVFTAAVACLIDLESLANAISLGTLMVFTFVDAGVILLRLQPSSSDSVAPVEPHPPPVADSGAAAVARTLGLVDQTSEQIRSSLRHSARSNPTDTAVDNIDAKLVWLIVIFTASALLASATVSRDFPGWVTMAFILFLGCTTVALLSLPKFPPPGTFACPMVPTVPLLGIVCNSYMMGSMPSKPWLLVSVWLTLGLLFYFGYGIHHSELRPYDSDDELEVSRALLTTSSREDDAKQQNYDSIVTG